MCLPHILAGFWLASLPVLPSFRLTLPTQVQFKTGTRTQHIRLRSCFQRVSGGAECVMCVFEMMLSWYLMTLSSFITP